MLDRRHLLTGMTAAGLVVGAGARADVATYTADDFKRVRKFDAHVHINADPMVFGEQAVADNFELLTINVDYPDFPSLEAQAQVSGVLHKADPKRFQFATAFSMQGFGEAGWADKTIAHIEAAAKAGARGVKVWKNVGLIERDASGNLVMLDDVRFDPVIARIEALGLTFINHQGEPRNCWLPLEEMTTKNDRAYFSAHPDYYMYAHPEGPSYEHLMAVRDDFLDRHPKLNFMGAHMASLEWSVDALSSFLDRFPNATVETAARMAQLQHQSLRDHDKVRNFFLKYQDRILYGSDLTLNPDADAAGMRKEIHDVWLAHWRYLATADVQAVWDLDAEVKGLALPKSAIDKIFYGNALRVLGLA
ncbi:amidohydrolase family protein [Asticcacaulis biprosthecium]|nr:amidohydrolase family protein [Asticcacaulis biprosthecium]